jgi:hypothetical protein
MSHPLQSSSIDKWIDAPTRCVDAAGAMQVSRRLGPATGVPVILLNHWGAVLDNSFRASSSSLNLVCPIWVCVVPVVPMLVQMQRDSRRDRCVV